jgi:hypothetical protein
MRSSEVFSGIKRIFSNNCDEAHSDLEIRVNKQRDLLWLILIGFFTFSLYAWIIFYLQTKPVSDFEHYYQSALWLLWNKTPDILYKYFQGPGYPNLLSILFKVFESKSILLPQIFNALLLTFLNLVLTRYSLVKNNFCKCIGFLVLIFNLNYLSMVSLICSEIPYAFFFGLGVFFVWRSLKRSRGPNKRLNFREMMVIFMAGMFLGISQSIRPQTFPFLLGLTVIIFLCQRFFPIHETPLGKIKGKSIAFLLIWVWFGFLSMSIGIYKSSSYGFTFQPLQNGLWNTYVGLNSKSKGTWNQDDATFGGRLGDTLHWDAKRMNQTLKPLVFQRFRENWLEGLKVLPSKLYHLLNPRDILYWSVEQSDKANKRLIHRMAGYLIWVNGIVLTISLVGWCILAVRRRFSSREEFFAFCVLGGTFLNILLHAYLLEVQPRYSNHLWLIIFWTFPLNLYVCWDSFMRRIFSNRKTLHPKTSL